MRYAESTDYPQMLDIHVACIEKTGEFHTLGERREWINAIRDEGPDRYSDLSTILYEDRNNGQELMGFVSWHNPEDKPHTAQIEHLFVSPDYRNHRVGSQLLQWAEVHSEQPTINVQTTMGSQQFYERRGYRRTEYGSSPAGFVVVSLQKVLRRY